MLVMSRLTLPLDTGVSTLGGPILSAKIHAISQFMPALTRCRSPCAVTPPDGCWLLTVPRAAGSDQTKGCNERGQCLAASKKFFLPRFSNLSSHSCFKSLMLLLDTYSSFVLLVFVRLVGFFIIIIGGVFVIFPIYRFGFVFNSPL